MFGVRNAPAGRSAGRHLGAVLTAVLVAAGAVLVVIGLRAQQHAPQPPPSAAHRSAEGNAPTSASSTTRSRAGSTTAESVVGPVLSRSEPKSITIDSIDLTSARLVDYGVDGSGAVDIPPSRKGTPAGWFTGSPTPGQLGPSVIVGHVDSADGPSVFYRVGAVRPGQHVEVARADGTTAVFLVDSVERFAKADFPTLRVYGNTDRAALRVITCGGRYDRATGHYEDNIVVFAHLVGSHATGKTKS